MKHRRMFKVELYGRVRRAILVEGRSQRAAAREFGIARKTIQKMLRYSAPPGYQRQQAVKRPKLGPWLGVIDAILEEDKARPAKQRHTATVPNPATNVKVRDTLGRGNPSLCFHLLRMALARGVCG
jgi:transposase